MDARFFILEVFPEKYLKKTSATILVLIKTLEGLAVGYWLYSFLPYVRNFIESLGKGIPAIGMCLAEWKKLIAIEQMDIFFPADLLVEGKNASGFFIIACAGVLVCLLLEMILICVEAVTLILLRFFMRGAAAEVVVQRIKCVIAFMLLLLFIVIDGYAFRSYFWTNGGVAKDVSFRTISVLIILTAGGFLLLTSLVRFHTDLAKVMAVIAYELKRNFKDLSFRRSRIGALSIVYGLLLALGAGIVGLSAVRNGIESQRIVALCLAVLSINYFMVNSCWGNYKLCHL